MNNAILKAIELVLSGDDQLINIIEVTLKMSLSSSLLALFIGVPLGVLLAISNFKGKRIILVLNRTLMGLPPVVCGLILYMLFSGVGPLGSQHLLFTVTGMIIAQVVLITPLMIGNTETFVIAIIPAIHETAKGLRLSWFRQFLLTMNESKYQIISTYLLGFARATAEVGAVSMVGGAIAYKTNVMTTAIMMYSNRGDFTLGIALGIILLLMSLALNVAIYFIQASISR